LLHGCNEIHRKCEKPVENLALKSRKLASNKENKHFCSIFEHLAKQGISIGCKTFPIFIDFSNPCQTDFHKKKYFAEK